MDVPMELSRIVISETSPHQIIFLKEKDGERTFPIVIGPHEAWAIRRRLNCEPTARPMTHELLAEVIGALGAALEKIVINDLRGTTFIAKLVLRRGSKAIEVDSRPSDAIALGAAFETPIFVAEHVLEQVVRDSGDSLNFTVQRERLELRRDELAEKIAELRELVDDDAAPAGTASKQNRAVQGQMKELQAELEAIEEILRHLPE